jgi:hypothetical protein
MQHYKLHITLEISPNSESTTDATNANTKLNNQHCCCKARAHLFVTERECDETDVTQQGVMNAT